MVGCPFCSGEFAVPPTQSPPREVRFQIPSSIPKLEPTKQSLYFWITAAWVACLLATAVLAGLAAVSSREFRYDPGTTIVGGMLSWMCFGVLETFIYGVAMTLAWAWTNAKK